MVPITDVGIDDLFLVHETKHDIIRDEAGNVVLKPMSDFDSSKQRNTLHFTLNHRVQGHMERSDSGGKNVIMAPLRDVLEANPGSLDNLYAVDTILTPAPGQGLIFPKDKTRVVSLDPSLDSTAKDKMIEDALTESGARFTFAGGVESSAQQGLDTHIKTNLAPQMNVYSKLHSGLFSSRIEDMVLEEQPNIHKPSQHSFSKTITHLGEEGLYKYGRSGVQSISELSDNAKARLFDNDFFISTSVESPAPDELLGTSPVAANPVTSFQTSQGSVYTYDSDGRVHRQKSTVGSSMEASSSSFDRTVFLPETDIESARLGLERGLKPTESGQLRGLDYDSSKMNSKLFMDLRFRGRKSYDEAFTAAGGTITERLITPSTEPQLGYNPLEYNIGDQKFHPGNVVTQISYKDGSTKQIELGTKSAETVSGTAKTKGADLYELGKKLHPQFEKDMPASLKTAFDEGRIKTLFRTSSMAIAGDMGIGRLKGGAIEGGDSLSLYAVDEDGRIARLGKGGMGWTGDPRMTGTTEKTTDATIFAEDVRYANPYVGGKSGNKDMLAAKDSMSKTPQVGFNPVEFDSKGGVHTGSFITDIYHSTGEAEFSDKITTGPRRRYFKNT